MTSDTPRRDLREVEAERVSKLEQRAIYMAEKQAELQIMQELRCRKQEDKTQALKRQCEAQLQSVQQARREAAAKRTARRQEVSSRAKELQDGEATAREAKVNGLDARRAQAISRLRAEQAQRLEAQKSDKSSKSKELAERLKYVEEQRESAIQQKLRAYEARQVRLESERRVKAEAQGKVKQIRTKCDMWKTYTKEKMAAGKHDELLGEIRDRRMMGLSPLSSPSSPQFLTPADGLGRGGAGQFQPPSRSEGGSRPKGHQMSGRGEAESERFASFEKEDTSLYESLMNVFESKVSTRCPNER